MQRRPALVASIATALILTAILAVALYLGSSNAKTSEIKARTVAQQVSNALEIMAADRVRALDDLVGHWPVASANEIDWFNVRAVTLAKMLPGLRDLALLDRQGNVLWSVDLHSRKQLLKQHLPSLLGAPLLAKSAVLYPPHQPQSLVVTRAISMQGRPHGYVAAFFDISTILGVYTSELAEGGLSFRMQDDSRVLHESGHFHDRAPVVVQPLDFAGRAWHFSVQSQSDSWQLSSWIAGVGSLVALCIGLLLYRQFAKEAQVRRFQQLYQSAADASLDAILLLARQQGPEGPDFILQQSNKVAAQLCDAALLLTGQSLNLLCSQLQADWFFRRCLTVDQTGQPFEAVLPQASGLIHASWIRVQVVKSAQGLALTFRDVSARKREEQQLADNEAKYRRLVEGLHGHFIYRTDLAGEPEFVSGSVEAITGYSVADFRCNYLQYQHHSHVERAEILAQLAAGRRPEPYLISYRKPDGSIVTVEYRASPVFDSYGQVIAVEGLGRDVTSEHALQQQIRYQAEHDQLTGLLNRYAFEHRLALLLEQPQPGALCYIDMDQFKHVNDSCGHLAGDELLRRVANLLSTGLSAQDILARVGGDEFCLVLTARTLTTVTEHLQQLLGRISAFRFSWEQQVFTIGASIGVVDLTGYQGGHMELLKAADSGCYLAKHQGRNRYFVVDANTPELNHLQQQRQLLSELHKALDQDSFELYVQPIVPLSVPQQGLHLEVLLRLRDAQGSMVSPALFIPLAEQHGLMGNIDRWVIRRVLQQLAATPERLRQLDKLAINLSGPSLSDPDLLSFIEQQLAFYAIPAAKICFEITETAAITNMAAANRFIDSLRRIGCKFALDDFGVGMSSFAYLKHLPVDYLKIDGSFVKAMTQNATDAVMVRAMADIARSLQIQTIAEFVPDEATCVLLRSIGVHYGQGYGLGHPAPWQQYFPPASSAVA